jgi:hypothetical protein
LGIAGDIDRGIKGVVWARQAFPGNPMLYVAGNHDHNEERILRPKPQSLTLSDRFSGVLG